MKRVITMRNLYAAKSREYFGFTREGIIKLINQGDNTILDVGCGYGKTGQVLKKEGKAKKIIGIELNPEAVEKAKVVLDEVILGNIEILQLTFEEYFFDYIILGDILEHLYDPGDVLRKVSPHLKAKGFIVASIPNVRHWSIIRNLVVKGEWEYGNMGLLDNTHLRFFTRKSILRTFDDNGFEVEQTVPRLLTRKDRLVNRFTLGFLEGFLAFQYFIKATRKV